MKTKLICFVSAFFMIFMLTACNTEDNKSIKTTKNISVQIIYEEKIEEIAISTEADTLREALEEKKLISGEEGQYGLFVKTVKGITADEKKQQWWCFTKGDEAIMTGVDMIEISDGDLFNITLKEGY